MRGEIAHARYTNVSCLMNRISWHQIPLVNALVRKAKIEIDVTCLEVEAMNDGGMGSLRFSTSTETSRFGESVAEATFKDTDGISVSAALFLDQDGQLFELDVFKADFSKLQKWPSESEID